MQPKQTLALLGLLGTLGATQASAHGLWTEQRRGNIEVVYGHGAEDDAFKPHKISGAWAYDNHGRMIPVTVQRLADHARLQPLKSPAVLAVALDNGPWSQTADKQWINKGHSQVPGAIASTHTFKYSLAIYQPGAKLPSLEQLKLVILPETDPLLVGPGKSLPVRVLLDGQPAPGVKLVGDYRNAPNTLSTETDAQGRAQVVVRNEGLNVIAAQVEVPLKDNPDAASRGLFTSLTFLGEPHHE
ncbi:nickel ABC transporter substrate-binding protein [Pseudomonas sp. ABAC61]|nr:nickel ABC transporter substrate-binding protein [Pseudomonas sp. ABAC61]